MQPAPKSLVLDLLSTLGRGAMPVRALVAAGRIFGIDENPLRVALTRLCAAGLVERDGRGAYRLGRAADAVGARVRGWRRLEERVRPWDGRWIGLVATSDAGMPARGLRRRRERALRWLGFRPLERTLWLRPDNLAGSVSRVRAELKTLGFDDLKENAPLVFGLDRLDALREARLVASWNASALVAGYRSSRRDLAASAKRLPGLPETEAMRESFALGGRVIRELVLDPLLPEPMVPAGERAALVRAMQGYDRVGRACWAEFLERHGAPRRRAPADVRLLAGPAPWVHVA